MKSKYTKEIVESAVKEASSIAGVIKSFGLKPTGGTYTQFQKLIRFYELDTSHFKGQLWNKGETKHTNKSVLKNSISNSYSDEEILVENSPPSISTYRLRELMIKHGKEHKCSVEDCGISEWLGEPITLHIDHINGINNDNRLENLRFLCPNCHQQTATWGRRKKR